MLPRFRSFARATVWMLVGMALWRWVRRRRLRMASLEPRPLEDTDARPPVSTVQVQTSLGKVRGFLAASPRGVELGNFRGIPFAQPPVGARRFLHAAPSLSWGSEVRDCTRFGYRSIANPAFGLETLVYPLWRRLAFHFYLYLVGWGRNQSLEDPHPRHVHMSEDCLTLNICVRSEALSPGAKARLPVAVFVHGGGFEFGAPSEALYAHRWGSPLAERDVVLVTVGYRLGLLGWAKVEQGDYNCGLSDVLCALEWVHEEIANFGGDPSQVCLFGQSAGAMLLSALMACPRAKGLYHRVILQSGAGCSIRSKKHADEMTRSIAEILKVRVASTSALHGYSAEQLFVVQNLLVKDYGQMPFTPVVDGVLVTEIPNDAIAHFDREIEIMVGITSDEASLFTYAIPVLPQTLESAVSGVSFAMRQLGLLLDGGEALDEKEVATSVMLAYSEHRLPEAFTQCISDFLFGAPAALLIDSASRNGLARIYAYEVDVHGPMGAAHGIELPFLHGTHSIDDEAMRYLLGSHVCNEHHTLSENMIEAWTSFFCTGRPRVPLGNNGSLVWPQYTPSEKQIMLFSLSRGCRVHCFESHNGLVAWKRVLSKIMRARAGLPPSLD